MRALYDPFLHGSGRHVRSEEWVSLALGRLDHYLHHHSRPIVACFDLSLLEWVVRCYHTLTLSIPIVFTIFFCILSSFVLSLFVFFYPRRSSFCFLNGMSSSIYNLSFGIIHLYVGWIIGLTQFFDIWHCALRGLVLSFGCLGFVSHRFIHLLPLAFITVQVIRPL